MGSSRILMLGLGLCGWVAASADDAAPFADLYLAAGTAPNPNITERSTDSLGATTVYQWKDLKRSYGLQASVSSQNGVGHSWGGWVWGAEVSGAAYDITPISYDVNNTKFANGSNATLRYRTLGLTALGGYEFGINPDDDEISGFFSVLPLIGGGEAWADNELHTGGSYTRRRGRGSYFLYGARFGGFLTEQRWVYGVTAQYQREIGRVDVDFPGGFSSRLTLKQSGFAFGLVAGYRF